jgi:pimeloyl-ACP methyl ester carboxylesterase
VRIRTDDAVGLDVTDHGEPPSPTGAPMLFVHEFGGDQRSWAPQVAHFRGTRRCVTYNARGYPPSDVPTDPAAYHQARAVADAVAVLDAVGLERAVVVGNSMGGFATLHLGLRHAGRCVALVVAGLAVLPRTGHLANLELPGIVDALIEEFLDSVGACGSTQG